ncbi:hypothetical protein [Epilithonimonas zeae]|uniref:hypothetical protein n=1 Tax=Epilithonimonas zeae TaxID=1416779 RepID=UPI00200D5978|nr:hypothetical protein [Epilithonimonas zeae]UQB69603.1 hypothetical protein KI430_04010 [Epilithonimonas zeae]
MKKTFFFGVLFLFTIQISAQENIATKEETMEWIAGKLKDALVEPRKYHSYNDGVFTYYGLDGKTLVIVDFKKATDFVFYWDEDYLCTSRRIGNLQLKGKDMVKYSGSNEMDNHWGEKELNDEPTKTLAICSNKDFYGSHYIFNVDNIAGLRERLMKAIMYLIELNVSKRDNEKF